MKDEEGGRIRRMGVKSGVGMVTGKGGGEGGRTEVKEEGYSFDMFSFHPLAQCYLANGETSKRR